MQDPMIGRSPWLRARLALLGALVALASGGARAAIFEFTIEPSQSWLAVDLAQSGMRFGVPGPFEGYFAGAEPQSGPGIAGGTLPGGVVSDGTRGSLSGTIRADVSPTRVSVLTASTLVTIGTFGTFLPGLPATPATPAPANLAVHLEDALFGIGGDVVLRGGRFSMFGQDLPITPTATPGRFTFSPGFALTPAWIDGLYTSEWNGVVSSLTATNIQPFSQNSVTATFEQLPGGGLRLTLPYNLTGSPFGFPLIAVPLPADLQVRATGQIVATAPEAGAAWPAIAALLLLAWRRGAKASIRWRACGLALMSLFALFALANAACGPSSSFEAAMLVDTQGEVSESAQASIDVGNGTLGDSDSSSTTPDATASASVAGIVDAQSVTAASTAERIERPFIASDPWALRVAAQVAAAGGPIDLAFSGAVSGGWNYSLRQGAALPEAIPVTLVIGVAGGAVTDTYTVLATVECDGQGPVVLVPNAATDVPIDASEFSAQGTCTASLSHEGTRSGVATTDAQWTAEIHFPRVPAQSTPSTCADEDPTHPYPISGGGCGDGIGTACINDVQCAPGRYCRFQCLAGAEGDDCDSDDQCQGDFVCALGKCGPLSSACAPVAQTGCEAGEKCDAVFGVTPQGVQGGVTRCAPDGLVDVGGACTAFSATPSSSCAAGSTCDGGVCRTWCRVASDCDAGEACDVSKGNSALDPGRDLLEGEGGRCKPAVDCLGCR